MPRSSPRSGQRSSSPTRRRNRAARRPTSSRSRTGAILRRARQARWPATRLSAQIRGRARGQPAGRPPTRWTSDLQPATRMYWRVARDAGRDHVRLVGDTNVQHPDSSGYSRAGELFDPLAAASRSGRRSARPRSSRARGSGSTIRTSYVRYQLAQTIANGEMSVEVEGTLRERTWREAEDLLDDGRVGQSAREQVST